MPWVKTADEELDYFTRDGDENCGKGKKTEMPAYLDGVPYHAWTMANSFMPLIPANGTTLVTFSDTELLLR